MNLLSLNNNNILNPQAYEKNTYVNILTNRVNINNKTMNQYAIGKIFNFKTDGPYIWATEEDFKKFCILNNLNLKIDNLKNLIQNSKMSKEFMETLETVSQVDSHKICATNTLNQAIFTSRTENPHDLDDHALHSLTEFRINGFEGPGVVTDVIDGDTVNIVVYVPLRILAQGHSYKYYSKKGIRSFIHTRFLNAGFFTKIRCRILGIDAMESKFPEGKFAKALTIDLYQRNPKVWVSFPSGDNIEDLDKFGRNLVTIYTNSSKKVNLNEYLFEYNIKDKKHNITIVDKYDGGKKSDYAKNLPKRSESETEKIQQYLDTKLEEIVTNNREISIRSSEEQSSSIFNCFKLYF